jgi:hypothetical protein
MRCVVGLRHRLASPPQVGVQSRHLMGWLEAESVWLFRPCLADVFIRREPLEGLEATGKVVVARIAEVVAIAKRARVWGRPQVIDGAAWLWAQIGALTTQQEVDR